MYIVTTSKTTGLNSYSLWSSLTTIFQVLLPVSLHSLPTKDIIQTSLFTLNAILLSPKPMTLLQILMSYRVLSKLKSLWPNSVIRNLLIYNIPPLLISKQMTKSLSRLSSSELLGLQKSFPKNILDSTKLFSNLVYYCLSSVFQSLYTLSIQFSIYLYSNLLHPTLSLRAYNQPLLQL